MKIAALIPAALALSLVTTDAHAWGAQGHRLVARIAEPELNPRAKAEVDRLLALEPGAALDSIAPWADQLRAQDPDLGRRSAGWHYINMAEGGCTYDPAQHCRNGNCVVQALKDQGALLANPQLPDAQRLQALKFVVHLVGDIHQPLHAGYGHDRGGNTYQLQYGGRGTNLHSVWDSGMFYTQQRDDAQFLAHLLTLPVVTDDSRPNLQRSAAPWAEQTCRIAIRKGLYPSGHKIDEDYADTWRPVAEAQVRLAGERLAAVLNELLGQPAAQP
ncbi:S1/P1 nuclease [Stenotrophomonas sp. SY1]|uniref:S1/P1 nuclease n=1 Tax=Stenotrophomonas sp. SY1 TaxID=477235 RepID=UPI001E51F91E|nr:S1/P1 nuclease [Stenotrophomonas sp. SY1]MCD9086109.1 S1/P1 nuclease [Stenotrophomonas sp. SY1]